MAKAHIPVDLFNPGQVFACLGFLEAADILLGDAEGGFDWSDSAATLFRLRAAGDENPFAHVLQFLAEAEVVSLAPRTSALSTETWRVPTLVIDSDAFPTEAPASPATLPARLFAGHRNLDLSSWGDANDLRDNVKFWAGAGGYPGAALLRDALDLARPSMRAAAAAPFDLAVPQSSSFRFDWRRDYVPIDVGFSPNEHTAMTMLGYPLTEILAAIGVSHARPLRRDKLDYRYAVIGAGDVPPPLPLHRAALGAAVLPFPQRFFRMRLDWPGQENQARCITEVEEENVR